MTDKATNTHNPAPATEPLALRLSEGLGPTPTLVERLRLERRATRWTRGVDVDYPVEWEPHPLALEAAAEIERLVAALKKANDQAEHFERLWYLTNEDAGRYAFAKTLEGQVVTMETFKVRGSAELDQALDDAMAEEAATHGGEPQSAVAAAFGGLVQTAQG